MAEGQDQTFRLDRKETNLNKEVRRRIAEVKRGIADSKGNSDVQERLNSDVQQWLDTIVSRRRTLIRCERQKLVSDALLKEADSHR